MVASKEIKRLEKSRVKVTVSVKNEDVRAEYESIVKEYAKNVQIKGFRKGKVPVSILEAKFKEELKADAMSRLMDKSLEEAMKDEEISILSYAQPVIDTIPEFALDKDFAFSVDFDVFPEVKVGDWKGIDIEVPECAISDEDMNRELEAIRERNAIVIEKDDEAKAEKTDIVTMNYCEVDSAGTVVAGTERQDFVFTVGTGYNIYKLDDDVIGMKKGDEKAISKTFPADYEYPELAGQTKKIKVSITVLKGRKLPDLDDDLAQDVSEKYKTLADLKTAIRAELEKQLGNRIKGIKEKAIMDNMIARNPIDLPDSMIAMELDGRYRDLISRMGRDSARVEQMLAQTGRTKETLFEEWKPESERGLKTRLILDALVEREKIEIEDSLMDAEYANMAEGSSLSAEEVKQQYESNNLVERLRDHLKENKLFETMFAAATIKKGKKVNYLDLVGENQ